MAAVTATLRDWQIPSAERLKASLVKYDVGADGSEMGIGKTYVICWVARELNRPLVVVCPRSVICEWQLIAESFGVSSIEVLNYDKVRTGKTSFGNWLTKGKVFEWTIRNDAILVFDEAHRCGGLDTQNAALLIAATRQAIPMILASGTLIGSPLKAYAIGYALGLHRLTNFWKWARANGVVDGFFGPEWRPEDSETVMQAIRVSLGDRFTRIRKCDVPGFPECQNIPMFVQTESMPDDASDYGMDARQAVELLKVPGLVDKGKELVETGFAVAIFVNFRHTLSVLYDAFPNAALVYGGQTIEERQEAIRRFQHNEVDIILLMAQAGGTGISLHDLYGRPRAALVCPGYDAIEFIQVLARIHRAGALSTAINYIIFASGVPVEHRIRAALERKLTNLSALNDFDLCSTHAQQSLNPPRTLLSNRYVDGDPSTGDPDQSNGRADSGNDWPGELPGDPLYVDRLELSDGPGGTGDGGGSDMSTKRAKVIVDLVVDGETTPINTDPPTPSPLVPAVIPKHENRVHATSSPSKLKNQEICPSHEGDNDGPQHPVTIRGIVMHEALETGDDSALIEGEHALVDMCRDYLADEIEWAAEVLTEVRLPTHEPDVYGYVDLMLRGPTETRQFEGQPKAFRRLKIRDFKMGFHLVELPDVNPQAIAYALAAFIGDPLAEEIDFAFLIPRQDSILQHTFTRADIPMMKLRISTIAERRRRLRGIEFNLNADNCLYCSIKYRCPKTTSNVVLPIANGYEAEDKLPLPTVFNPEQITEPAQLALMLNTALVVESWAEQVRGYALKYRLELGQEIPGYDLIEKKGNREVADPNAAYLVAKEFGVSELEYIGAAKMSVTALDKVVKEHAAEGDKAEAVKRFTDRLMEANALARGNSYHVLQKSRKKKSAKAAPTLVAPAATV